MDKAAKEINAFTVCKKEKQNTQQFVLSTKEKVIVFIKATLSPEKIFLLHHAIKEDNTEYFDLLVVIPESAQTSFSAYEQLISMANIEQANITVSLHKAATLYRQLEEGHIYYSIACNKENLVYDKGECDLPQADRSILKMLAEKAGNEFKLSYKKAGSFLQGAINYNSVQDNQMAAFMLQQCVELMLRGLITALLGSCAKTHCIRELKKPLKRCAPELQYLLSANEAEEGRLLLLLEKAYLESRYADIFDMSDNDMKLLTKGVEDLYTRAETVFINKIQVLEK